ncbi:hypothetical protein V6N11_037800 [Hibiscus sabdariffa]|uniref:Uncharacterized protein n=1 Tax=Hibiscus sabdariffa TaxID=183260 RepID=A0ABR2NAZ2_9ROSI
MGVCRRARKLAKDDINGNYKYEFKRLFDYANALKRADNDGTINLLVERLTPNHRPMFRRFYSNVGNEGNTSESIPNLLFILSLRIMCLICHPLAPQALRMSLQAEPPPQLHQHPCSNRRTPPTPHCSTEPPIPHVPTPTATPHVSTVHVPSNKKKGKEKYTREQHRNKEAEEGKTKYDHPEQKELELSPSA